jgi:hypothetical protein
MQMHGIHAWKHHDMKIGRFWILGVTPPRFRGLACSCLLLAVGRDALRLMDLHDQVISIQCHSACLWYCICTVDYRTIGIDAWDGMRLLLPVVLVVFVCFGHWMSARATFLHILGHVLKFWREM